MECGWRELTGRTQEKALWGDSMFWILMGLCVTREHACVKGHGIGHLRLVCFIARNFHLKKRKRKRGREGKEEGRRRRRKGRGRKGKKEGGRKRENERNHK